MKINKSKLKPRTPQEVRAFVKKVIDQENLRHLAPAGAWVPPSSSGGKMVAHTELERAKDKIALIPNARDRERVVALFSTVTKYQALQSLLHGELGKKFPEVMEQIADAMTEADYAAEVDPPA
jgi:hypothetical protein